MQRWMKITAAAVPVAILLILLIVFLRRFCSSKQPRISSNTPRATSTESLQPGITKLHLTYETNNHKNLPNFHHYHHRDLENRRKPNYNVFRRGLSAKPFFNWADNPSLVSEAVEHGWSRFAFTGYNNNTMSSSSTRSVLLGLCASGDQGREMEAEISWEVCQGSADFMQKIRFNSGLKKTSMGSSSSPPCVIKTSLPLPGPPLGNSAFPQEAYFEITILSNREDDIEEGRKVEERRGGEGERTKLIQESTDVKVQSDSLIHVSSNGGNNRVEELKVGNKEESRGEAAMFSVGLSVGGPHLSKLAGTYSGSIGFNSNGSVYLDGIKLVFEAEKAVWGSPNMVIGCGFDPNQKKVFFTVDSELVHLVHCKSEAFATPLYPILAANIDAMILVNFGQSAFSYAPANLQRTPNPCFTSPLIKSPAAALGYEDSRELFSMGRIDSQWLNRSTTRSNHYTNNNGDNTSVDVDQESETDLFEIVLDNWSRSPSRVR